MQSSKFERYERYEQLSEKTLENLTFSKNNWINFLGTASKMYKYSFDEQILIHAQRPDTKACASFDFWTADKKMNRHVKRGSKGIALLNHETKKLYYVYAVEDTENRTDGKSKNPKDYIWKMSLENESDVKNMINQNYGISSENIIKSIVLMSNAEVRQQISKYSAEFEKAFEKFSRNDIPKSEMIQAFWETVSESVAYMTLERCGYNPKSIIKENAFRHLDKFDLNFSVLIGKCTTDIAKTSIRQIEKTVGLPINQKRSNENEQLRTTSENNNREWNRVHSGRGNRNISPELQGGRTSNDGQIWSNEGEISQGELRSKIQSDVADEHSEQASDRNKRTGTSERRTDSQGTGGSRRNGRTTENIQSAGMGGKNEQLHSDSGGNSLQGTDLHLTKSSDDNFSEKVHSAFAEVAENHKYTAKQQGFIEHLEKFIAKRHITENIIDEISKLTAFQNRYGSIKNLSRYVFAGQLRSFEKEISESLKKHTSENQQTAESNKNTSAVSFTSEKQLSFDDISDTKANDFHITDDELGTGGAKTKFKANIEAIKTLKLIESENRSASPDEQQILSKYVGWGGLPQAFDENNQKWNDEYLQLKELLTPEEYRNARASTQNAHYTSPVVIESIYKALENNGFKGGRILEPAVGTGNFFGKMPETILKNSRLTGVELDSITGRIAKQLYQNANIQIKGFETTDFRDNYFDLAIGNVPFGSYKLSEKRYDKYNFNIHDHFFAKSLDKVKSGGIIAFISSKGTLDKKNPDVRKYLAERAELAGAIRLPNNAFKANAGTEVTTDIIFLKKRENPIELTQENTPDWVYLGKTESGLTVNQYFVDNPQMLLGKIVSGNKLYGHNDDDTMCIPFENSDLKELLNKAVSNIQFEISSEKADLSEPENIIQKTVEIPQNLKNFSYAVINDKLYFRENDEMKLFSGTKDNEIRIKGLTEIRDCLRNLIDCQLNNSDDDTVKQYQQKLNSLYDNFTEKYGLINNEKNRKLFREDTSLPLILSLENIKNGKFIGKAPIFEKRTIKPNMVKTHADTSSEALGISISQKACVDIDFMMHITGFTKEKILDDLKGVVFENPIITDKNGNPHLETSDEYLSGNIRQKLEYMKENFSNDLKYSLNINALEIAMPKPLEAGDIDIKLGATWISPKIIQQFIYETLNTPSYLQDRRYNSENSIKVEFSPLNAEWNISNRNADRNNIIANSSFGTEKRNAYHLIEDCLNMRSTKITKKVTRDGKEVTVTDTEATELAQEKQKDLQSAFKEWIFQDSQRREEIVNQYNVIFNSSKPREYDGSHLEFVGMNAEIKLMEHQKNAVAHALYGGNTLFAHEVGAGKTFEMIATAMEGKYLGLHSKSLFAVPNHLTEQIGNDFIKLYPNANILVATADDFKATNRKKLFSKIATGDFDAIIIGHSQLTKIPVSVERQEKYIRKQIDEIIEGIKDLKASNNESFKIKQMEKSRKTLETKLEKLLNAPKRDDVIDFEQLGIDKIFVDEAHLFKNLFLSTKMRNVSGISTNDDVQKTADLYLKCQYLDELTGGKGIVFATGTPVSNSISEIYSMMKYLQSDLLEQRGLKHFDAWASNFAETVTESQLLPEGNGYQMKTRFANFNNLPELMSMFKECADIKTIDTLNLKVPECETTTIVAQPTQTQKDLMFTLSERANRVRMKIVNAKDDNMPMITTDGKKIGLDQRLINPNLPDEPDTKINLCVDNVFKIWNDTKENKSTQLIFSDLGVPQTKADIKKKGKCFCVYDDIKEKLIKKGIPENQIAFIHDAKTEDEKDKLFAKVKNGEIRVLIGSTQKMGAGTNVQDKLIASHDLDAPWKPADMEQRRGRMVRQGNENKKVHLYRYVTEGTFDAYLYQTLENKQKFISQIMTSKSPVRSCQDVDNVSLSFAEIKALSVGNPMIKEKMDLEVSVAKLKRLKAGHQNTQYQLEDKVLKILPKQIAQLKEKIDGIKKDIQIYSEIPVEEDKFSSITIKGQNYSDKETAGKALLEAVRNTALNGSSDYTEIGQYQGFKLTAVFDVVYKKFVGELKGNTSHKIEFGSSESGNITRLDNVLNSMGGELKKAENTLADLQKQLDDAKNQLNIPFPHEKELHEKSARLEKLTKILENDAEKDIVKINQSEKNSVCKTSQGIKR